NHEAQDVPEEQRAERQSGRAVEPPRGIDAAEPSREHLRPAVVVELLRKAGQRERCEQRHDGEMFPALARREASDGFHAWPFSRQRWSSIWRPSPPIMNGINTM